MNKRKQTLLQDVKISAGSIYSDETYEVSLEPEEYETFQKASLVALQIPWDFESSRVKDMEIQGIQVITSKGTWRAVVRKVDNDEDEN